MKRVTMSRRARHMVLWLQWLLLLGSIPLPSVSQNLPSQMEMQAAGPVVMPLPNAPAVDCKSFAYCCVAPPVPMRAFGTPERPDPVFTTAAWQRHANDHIVGATSRHTTQPTVALRVLHCCWRN